MLKNLEKFRQTNEEGFTLVELMIVVVIIGILAAIAIPIFLNQQKAAVDAGVTSDTKNLLNSITAVLIKAPTSEEVCGTINDSVDAIGVELKNGSIAYARAKVSNPETIIVVTNNASAGTALTDSSQCGKWNDFAITAYNPNSNFNSLNKALVYKSTTGKIDQL